MSRSVLLIPGTYCLIFPFVRFKTTNAGAYKFCFDNTHTRYSKKSVSLRLTRKGSGETNWEEYNQTNLAPEGNYGGKVVEFSVSAIIIETKWKGMALVHDGGYG